MSLVLIRLGFMKAWVRHAAVNWKTTLIGFAHGVNAIAMVLSTLQQEHKGVVWIDQTMFIRFVAVSGVLKVIAGVLEKDATQGSDRKQEVVDRKLDNVAPIDEGVKA